MGCDTYGRIKGHIRPENIVNFIRQKWDMNAKNGVSKHIYKPISMCDWNFKINDNCDDRYNWYVDYGFIISNTTEKKELYSTIMKILIVTKTLSTMQSMD